MEQAQQVQDKRHDHILIKIVVNGRERQVDHEVLTYTEVVALAFPNPSNDPNLIFHVTYEKAASRPPEGILAEGQKVTVKEGTIFNVRHSNKS